MASCGGHSDPAVPDRLPVQPPPFEKEREAMVALLGSGAMDPPIRDARVLGALGQVPRHEFVPPEFRSLSYENRPLPLAEEQTISQPYIVALMTQLLELKGDEKVLEIGTGSGYQAAILAELAREVYTVEIRESLHATARERLESLRARGLLHGGRLEVILGDGALGYPPGAPYDAIIVTAAPREIPPALLEQLKPGGRLVAPVGDYFQELRLFRKGPEGTSTDEPIVPVRFVPLVRDTKAGAGETDGR